MSRRFNEERIQLIEACLARASGTPSAEEALRAFIAPTLRPPRNLGEPQLRLRSGRASKDPSSQVKRVLFESYDAVARNFAKGMAADCPHLPHKPLSWRVACVYGAMLYIRADNGRLQRALGEGYALSDLDGAVRFASLFLTAGVKSLASSRPRC